MEQLSTDFFGEEFGPEIKLENEELVRPFQYKTEFLPADLVGSFQQDSLAIVLCSRFRNQGLRGMFAAYALGKQAISPEDGIIPETTPLGQPTDYRFEWQGGLRVPVNPPLGLAMLYQLRNDQDVDTLRRFYYEFAIGNDSYFMMNDQTKISTPSLFIDGALYDREGDRTTPVLTHSLDALSQVRVATVSLGNPTKFDIRRVGPYEYAIVSIN